MESPASWDLLTASIAASNLQKPFTAWAFLVVQGLVRDMPGDREIFVEIVVKEKDRDITGPSAALRVASSLRRAEIALEAAKVADPWGEIASERLKVLGSWTDREVAENETSRRKSWWKPR